MSSVNARVPPSRLAAIDSPADGEVAAYQASSGQFEWVANGSGGGGTVTSIALTESGNALTITGSPITGAGTFNIAGAGSSSQVILGDLTLATLPTGTIGGSSTANQVSFGDTTANEITSSGNLQFLSGQNLYVAGRIQIGNATGTKLTTVSSQNLVLDTNEGTDSGSIVIESGTNGQISLTPDGTGLVKIDGVGINNSAIATGYILKATSTTEAGWVAESGGGFTGSLADTQVAFGNTTADSIQGSSSLTVTGSGSTFKLNNTGKYKAANGSTSDPAYHMTGDADTGMYLITNGRLGFCTNGERQVQIRDAEMTLGGNGYSTEFILQAEGATQDLSIRSGGGDAGGVQYAEILLQPDNGNIEVRPEGTGKIQFHDAYTFPTAVTSDNDYVLTAQTDGTTAWAAAGGGGGSPGGSDTQVQFNDGGSFGGNNKMVYTAASGVLTLTNYGQFNNIQVGFNAGVITTNSAGNMTLQPFYGINAGSIIIGGTANSDITLTPNGSGLVQISGAYKLPGAVTSTDGFVLSCQTDGSTLWDHPHAISGTPASSTATGKQGSIQYDSSYFYVCVATNTWRRVALSSW